jgi:hypothetical protein
MAYFKDYPDSTVDSAAFQLLMGSLPEHWQNIISTMDTAHQAYDYIMAKFSGGSNQQVNPNWQRELEEGMRPSETLEQYAMRFQQLFKCL